MPSATATTPRGVRLYDDYVERLRIISNESGLTISWLVNRAVRDFLTRMDHGEEITL